MTDHLFVTIGMPVYNAENFIKLAIISVLEQSHNNFELIITDDGSTDRSMEIAESFNDPRIILLKDSSNKGISHRLNQQIDLATGKYFLRMDSDDIMFPDRVEKQILFLEQNPTVDVVGSYAVVINNDNEILGIRQGVVPADTEVAAKASIFIHPTVCGKSSWFKKFKYDGSLDGVEDFDLWLRSWAESTFKIIDEPLLFYREPLEFKLKVYLNRLKKQRILFKENLIFQDTGNLSNKLIFSSHLKGILARFVNFVKGDKFFISRRNKPVNLLENNYKNIIDQLKTIETQILLHNASSFTLVETKNRKSKEEKIR